MPEEKEEYILVTRKKPKNPVWLKEYQNKLKDASKIAAEQTKHLKGPARVARMNQIIAERTKKR